MAVHEQYKKFNQFGEALLGEGTGDLDKGAIESEPDK